jgi:hypothetical protein
MDTPLEIASADKTSQLLAGSNELVDIKALQPTLRGGGAIHTSVINRMHELILV